MATRCPRSLKSAELFAGYGGLGMAVERGFQAETVWFSEFDAAPSKILTHHWPDVPNFGDVTQIDWEAIAADPLLRPHILSGGFPCQDVSLAGQRAGMTSDTRSGLWFHFLKGIIAMQPEFVLFENVRGILSAKAVREMEASPETLELDAQILTLTTELDALNDELEELYDDAEHRRSLTIASTISGLMEQRERVLGGEPDGPVLRALGAVLGDLADAGYDAQWSGLRAADVGAPHGRFRVFGIGVRRDLLNAA